MSERVNTEPGGVSQGSSRGREIAIVAAVVAVLNGGQLVYSNSEYVTREDAEAIVEKQSPYLQDRGQIMTVVEGYPQKVQRLTEALSDLRLELAELKGVIKAAFEEGKRGRERGRRR